MGFPETVTPDDAASPETVLSPETVAVVAATAIYSKAFLEELGKRSGEGFADLLGRIRNSIHVRREAKNGNPEELHIDVETGEGAVWVVVTEDLPDEARLALLDLDVTVKEFKGRTLRWNATAGAWLAEGAARKRTYVADESVDMAPDDEKAWPQDPS